ncbi:MAG: hypothetical protein K9H64_09675 [Bacteroidales bacterium]|nr:hypothetical protein [Bacteroidales bacterium]MCF8456169.1 hypothetical protein [Bacteroidales bacterium]
MNKTASIALLLIVVSTLVNGQGFIDQILLKSGDTITCKISLINDQNIFYTYKKKRTEKHDFVPLMEVVDYTWVSKDIKNQIPPKNPLPLYNSKDKWHIGIILSQQFNYPLRHTSPGISLSKRNHNLWLGPEYTLLLENPPGDPIEVYKKNCLSLGIGYRYIFNSSWKNINLFLQTNFSFVQVEYKEYQLGPPFVTNRTKIIVENTMAVGANYQLPGNFELFGGIGFGSYDFFLMALEHFIPHATVGVEYIF